MTISICAGCWLPSAPRGKSSLFEEGPLASTLSGAEMGVWSLSTLLFRSVCHLLSLNHAPPLIRKFTEVSVSVAPGPAAPPRLRQQAYGLPVICL